MFHMGMPELILILVIALVVFGPKKLPEIGKALGKGLKEFKQETSGERKEEAMIAAENKKPEEKKDEQDTVSSEK